MPESRVFGADDVARKEFPTSFRGFDQHAVRAFLGCLAAELAALQTRERSLEERLTAAEARAVPTEIGETELENALGVETAKVLHAAREAAAEIRSRSEEQVARLLREAGDEASRLREEAGTVLAARTAEAERAAAAIREEASREAADRRAAAAAAAEATIESAKEEGRRMVGEAHAVRERILKDLARRRRSGHQQLEQLRAGRDRLLQACRDVQAALDTAVAELVVSEPEARAAAETAGLRVADEPEMSLEELDAEVVAAVDAGLVVPAHIGAEEQTDDGGGPAEEARGPAAGAAPGPAAEDDRAGSPPSATASPAEPTFAEIIAGQANPFREQAVPVEDQRASPLRRRKRGAPATVSVVDVRDEGEGVRLIPNEPPSTPSTPPEGTAPADSAPEDSAPEAGAGASEGAGRVGDDEQRRPNLTLVAPGRAEAPATPGPGVAEPAGDADEQVEGEAPGATAEVGDQLPAETTRTDREALEQATGDPLTGDDGAASGVDVAEDPGDEGPEAEDDPKPAVDDVFARIRAGRAAAVAHANEVLADDGADALPVTASADETVEPVARTEGPVGPDRHAEAPVEPDAAAELVTAFEQRDAAVEPHERTLTKSLKRALADEQNELLDALRTARGVPQLDTLLPAVDEHEARYRTAGEPALTAMAAAGAGVDDAVDIGEVIGSLGREVVGGLRPRLEHALLEAAGDEAAANAALSAVYREWKTSRVEPLARHHVLAAYAEGAFAAADEGAVRWVVDPDTGCSPDCADNALAGPTGKGEPFPTGQAHPPAHAGCRCLVLPAAN